MSKKDGLAIVTVLPVILYFKGISLKKLIYPILLFIVTFLAIKLFKSQVINEAVFRDVKFFENPLLYSDNFMDRITVECIARGSRWRVVQVCTMYIVRCVLDVHLYIVALLSSTMYIVHSTLVLCTRYDQGAPWCDVRVYIV